MAEIGSEKRYGSFNATHGSEKHRVDINSIKTAAEGFLRFDRLKTKNEKDDVAPRNLWKEMHRLEEKDVKDITFSDVLTVFKTELADVQVYLASDKELVIDMEKAKGIYDSESPKKRRSSDEHIAEMEQKVDLYNQMYWAVRDVGDGKPISANAASVIENHLRVKREDAKRRSWAYEPTNHDWKKDPIIDSWDARDQLKQMAKQSEKDANPKNPMIQESRIYDTLLKRFQEKRTEGKERQKSFSRLRGLTPSPVTASNT